MKNANGCASAVTRRIIDSFYWDGEIKHFFDLIILRLEFFIIAVSLKTKRIGSIFACPREPAEPAGYRALRSECGAERRTRIIVETTRRFHFLLHN